MNKERTFILRYSHNIIEHLGLKLYQNKPTNVLAELISNSWDADAKKVWIDVNESHLAVMDNGIGMSRDLLIDNYLVIGKKKRTSEDADKKTQGKRRMMGRKGIGKLAPFGIAQKLSVITVNEEDNLCYWLEIDLAELLNTSEDNSQEPLKYEPKVICDGTTMTELPLKKDPHGYVQSFIKRIGRGGTLVILDNLSLKKQVSIDQLRQSIGQRFTVTLLRDDFKVLINGNEVTEAQALPKFALRIPEKGSNEETVHINGKDRRMRYWVGFVKQAEWPQDQAGVGVYAHGKIAQDRPFVFGLKGREITTRYMYGVIEADWLDELADDVVSTDRTTINWDNDFTEPMYQWGQNLVASWVGQYRKKQKSENEGLVLRKLKELPDIPKITDEEQLVIKDMVCNMSPKIYKDDSLQNEVITKLTAAWTIDPREISLNLYGTRSNAQRRTKNNS